MSETDFLISELKKHNIKIFSDIDKFVKTYSAAQNIHQKIKNTDTCDNNEEDVEKLIKISNLNEQYKTDEQEVEKVEIKKEVVEEKVKQDEMIEEEFVKVDNELSNKTIFSSVLKQKEEVIKVPSETRSESSNKLNYFDCSNKSDDNKIPKNSKTAQALSSLYRAAHKLYQLVVPPSSLNSENVNDTMTTFVNTNFMETDESIQENPDSPVGSSFTSNEITTQTTTPKQRDYYFESLEQILYDPFTSIIHKSYCLKHGRRNNKLKNRYPRISKDSCYEKAANIGNAIKKFECLIQEDQKQEFRFKSETMRQTALCYQKNK